MGPPLMSVLKLVLSLSPSHPAFSQFTTNYVMSKLRYNMTQLLNELQTFEAISKTRPKEGKANVAEHKRSFSSDSKNKKRKNTQGKS